MIDDEPSVHEVVRAYLEREGFIVYSADNGLEGLRLAESKQPALLVLDLMLPDLSGEEICREVRRRSDVPILMLTAKSAEEDRVTGLELGADDYLAKPFSPRELVARVKAVLRRTGGGDVPLVEHLSFDGGALRIDTSRREVVAGDRTVDLTPSEYALLLALAQYPGRVYSRFELINRVRGYDFEGYERTIDAHVKNLRKKIEPDPARPRYVETVHGVGYRLGAKPS
ncbi:response regulator transcription factor [Thermoleophilum album]|uniref:response regulator transcription factor n=1 Tax=Thermoleophilum album TaxID=29539 RepID=UPI001C40B962|nr:response regulator transcription factor [Thermoleophilum album]